MISPVVHGSPNEFKQTYELMMTTMRTRQTDFQYSSDFTTEGRRLCHLVNEALFEPEPKVNVYQAALCILSDWGYGGCHHHRYFVFRGERDINWSLDQFEPFIFRELKSNRTLEQLRSSLDFGAQSFRALFRDRDDSDVEILAILQHYGCPTWLVDVTTSPFVALFFASYSKNIENENNENNKTGIVYAFSRDRITSFKEVESEIVPTVRQISPSNVPRIASQHGLFLDGGHGWVARNLVLSGLAFRNSREFHFEDPELGISSKQLLSTTEPWSLLERTLKDIGGSIGQPGHNGEDGPCPPADYGSKRVKFKVTIPKIPEWPPSVRSLQSHVASMMRKLQLKCNEHNQRLGEQLGRLHFFICEDKQSSSGERSFNTFQHAVELMIRELALGKAVGIEDFSRFYDGVFFDTGAAERAIRKILENDE